MPNLKLLGTAAGGGFPQWNCACTLCSRSRSNPLKIPARRHLQAIFGDAGDSLFLINASPDLRFQIESEPLLWPQPSVGSRNTPIAGIILTSADLDQVLGILLLREFQPLTLYATAAVRRVLEANTFFRMLERVPNQLTWREIVPGQPFAAGRETVCTPIALPGGLPFYARHTQAGSDKLNDLENGQALIGLLIESGGSRIAYTPSLPEVTEQLLAVYESCDAILVDGTFWSDAELSRTHEGTPTARSIGHLPMSGAGGMIEELASLKRPKKIFIHINNTNPILDPESKERRQLVDAGWQVAEDGWQWK